MFATAYDRDEFVARRRLAAAPTDAGELETWCRDSIAANAKPSPSIRPARTSAINAFKGPLMKAAKGQATEARRRNAPASARRRDYTDIDRPLLFEL